MKIVPAILTDKSTELTELIELIRKDGRFDRVQIDFIDGEYAANKTIKPSECDLIPYAPIKFDAQLMVVERNMRRWAESARELGFDRIIPQVESISHPEDYDCLAMDFHSPAAVLEPYLANLKYVLVMSVEPGFGGQSFVNTALDRIRQIKQIRQIKGYNFLIGVDGGVDRIHLDYLEKHGADEVAVGTERVLSW